MKQSSERESIRWDSHALQCEPSCTITRSTWREKDERKRERGERHVPNMMLLLICTPFDWFASFTSRTNKQWLPVSSSSFILHSLVFVFRPHFTLSGHCFLVPHWIIHDASPARRPQLRQSNQLIRGGLVRKSGASCDIAFIDSRVQTSGHSSLLIKAFLGFYERSKKKRQSV